MVETCRKSVNI